MKTFISLAYKSLWHRKDTVLLTISSLILSVFLILSVERLRRAAEDGFTQTISQTDLVVGARTGPLNLVLSTVFNRGVFANNIHWATFKRWTDHPAVEWTIPLVLGDGHRGYRVMGTTDSFFKNYRYQGDRGLLTRAGAWFSREGDVVIGAEVAEKLNYQLGSPVIVEHGVTRDVGMLKHDAHPFKVAGILAATGTIIDQTLFVSMENLEDLHHPGEEKTRTSALVDNHKGQQESEEQGHHEDSHQGHEDHHEDHQGHHEAPQDHRDAGDGHAQEGHGDHRQYRPSPERQSEKTLTGFFLKLKNRVDILQIQRTINNETKEPLSAVIPSVAVNELWQMLGQVEKALRLLGFCILGVSLLSLVAILLATLNERRREMAILRSLGAHPHQLVLFLMFEASMMTFIALVGGVFLQYLVTVLAKDWLASTYGLFLQAHLLTVGESALLLMLFVLGTLVGVIPAWRAYRSSLKDGLIVR